jgi:hypothetical protein
MKAKFLISGALVMTFVGSALMTQVIFYFLLR